MFIETKKGQQIEVDDEDAAIVSGYNWRVTRQYGGRTRIVASIVRDGKLTTICLPRLLTGNPEGFEIMYKDGNALNNRRENLKLATRSEILSSRGPFTKQKIKMLRGRDYSGRYLVFVAQLEYKGRNYDVGYFPTRLEAMKAITEKLETLKMEELKSIV